jgi:hypothetical protein
MILKITFFPFPISNHDAIRHKKYLKRNYFKIINLKYLKAFKIIIVSGILKSP